MRNALRLVLALSGASIFGATLLLACSDDTAVKASTEAGVPPGPDGGGTDSPIGDGGADTAPPFDGGFVVDTFDTVLATELCKSLARCCFGTSMPAEGGADGGTFDMNQCVRTLQSVGFQGSNLETELRDAGHVALNQVAADDCITKIKALTCDLPGTEYTATRASCFSVYAGKLAAGSSCRGSVECQPGNFCKGIVTDGGTGVCTALSALNGPCGANPDSLTEYEETCSYRAGGGTGNYCHWTDDPATQAENDAGTWTCLAAGGMGASCVSSTWCKDTICDPDTMLCTSPNMIAKGQCTTFVK
jgi:hypothetical protein